MSPLRYQKWLRLNEVRRPMLNEHYDVTTAAYAVGYESYPISVGNIRGCLESHPREIIRCPCDLKILSFFVKCNNPGNYILRATTNQE